MFLVLGLAWLFIGAADLREWWHGADPWTLARAIAFLVGTVVWLVRAYRIRIFPRRRQS